MQNDCKPCDFLWGAKLAHWQSYFEIWKQNEPRNALCTASRRDLLLKLASLKLQVRVQQQGCEEMRLKNMEYWSGVFKMVTIPSPNLLNFWTFLSTIIAIINSSTLSNFQWAPWNLCCQGWCAGKTLDPLLRLLWVRSESGSLASPTWERSCWILEQQRRQPQPQSQNLSNFEHVFFFN